MNWLIRYILGLPAREQDFNELKANFPELIENPKLLRNLEYPYFIHPWKLEKDYFEKWISEIDSEKKTTKDSDKECPFTNCPISNQETIFSDSHSGLIQLMTIGSGLKSPKESFFDMVRKLYKNTVIRKVYLTDPYLLADVSEDGNEGGFNNLVDYLNIIIRDKKSDFELLISKTVKQQSKLNNFKRSIKNIFHNVEINNYYSPYHIHDRLLITIDNKGIYKGMFGPSFNGLNSKSIVLFGELEYKNTLDKIKKWFDTNKT